MLSGAGPCMTKGDVDGDADLDLAAVSAGYALTATDSLLRSGLCLNQEEIFVRSKASEGLTALRNNGSVIIAADIDTDGVAAAKRSVEREQNGDPNPAFVVVLLAA